MVRKGEAMPRVGRGLQRRPKLDVGFAGAEDAVRRQPSGRLVLTKIVRRPVREAAGECRNSEAEETHELRTGRGRLGGNAGENILRKLTQERIIELKKIIQEEAQQYTKVKEDIILIQSGVTDEKKLREMWKQIELEKAQKEKEQLLHAQWLKEREEKKLELERQWRPAYPGSPNSTKPPVQVTTVKVKEDTDEDSQSSSKSGTSPLLTSLLKSPTSNQAGTPGMQAVAGRSPSITNLLTGNSHGMNIQGKNLFPTAGSTSTQLQDDIKPIEGTSSYQIAPNLTKLLDTKQQVVDDKTTVSGEGAAQVDKTEDMEIDADNVDPAKDLMAVFQELMPEELVEILNENNGMILEDEILDNVVDSIMEEEAESLKGKDLSAL
ncbi:hypothetical protein pipiens_012862, partial [Culex pipiens pipiens]